MISLLLLVPLSGSRRLSLLQRQTLGRKSHEMPYAHYTYSSFRFQYIVVGKWEFKIRRPISMSWVD